MQSDDETRTQCKMDDFLIMKGPQAASLQALCDSLDSNIPILVTTNDSTKLLQAIKILAKLKPAKLRRILLSDRSDTTQLLGCFEQTSHEIQYVMNMIR